MHQLLVAVQDALKAFPDPGIATLMECATALGQGEKS
jgi:hypothetical protein